MAPATKYGGKIVVCQPGTMPVAKSKLTTVCTERTSGVASPASSKYADWYRCQCRADPRHPIDSIPKITCCQRLFARSRSVARSGNNPTNQNNSETVPYVDTAKTSQISGLRNCGQIPIVLGYGNM